MIRHLLLLSPLLAGCTYEGDLDPGEPQLFEIISYAPKPGEVGVDRNARLDLKFNVPPDAAHVASAYLRVFSGLYEKQGTLRVDLLERRVRFTPTTEMRSDLRYQVFVSARLRGLNGVALADNIFFDFTTGRSLGLPPRPGADVSARALQPVWNGHCLSCHGAAPRARVDLSSAAAAITSLKGVRAAGSHRQRVVPGDHAASYLMLKLLDQGGIAGHPMPPSGSPLSATQLRQVADWIDGGARP